MLLRPRQILAPVLFATVFGYFGYHLVNGDRGLLAMAHLQREVLIAEQNLHFCLGVASHATVIDKGQIVHSSTIEELKANDDIRRRYLAL